MKRTLILNVLAVLAAAALIFVLLRSRSPFGNHNSSFAPESNSEISEIEISDGGGGLVLQNRGGKWTTSDGTEVRRNGVSFITAIIKGMRIKSPVSDEMFGREVLEKKIVPARVKVYSGRKLLTSFQVYRVSTNIYGNIMKVTPRSKPFIVHLPGFEGDIGSVFTSNSLYWQPYVIFNIHPDEIGQVSLYNFADTAASFTITTGGGTMELSWGGKPRTGWDPQQVRRYISYFTFIAFDEWAEPMPREEMAGIESAGPAYEIEVRTVNGDRRLLTLWEKIDVSGDSIKTDLNRLYGKLNNSGQLFLVRYFDIDPVLKKRSYFFVH